MCHIKKLKAMQTAHISLKIKPSCAKWIIYAPSPKAQGSLSKRRWKKYKSLRQWIATRKQCP